MTVHTLTPGAAAPARPRPRSPSLANQLAVHWWWSVRKHVAEANGFPREAVEDPPEVRWPFAHL